MNMRMIEREGKMEDQPHIDYIHLDVITDQNKQNNPSQIRRNSCSALQSFITNINNTISPVIKPAFVKSQRNDQFIDKEIPLILQNASLSSEYPPEVCQKILHEFQEIQRQNR